MGPLSIRSGPSSQTTHTTLILTCTTLALLGGGCLAPAPRPPGPPLDPAALATEYPAIDLLGAQTLADFQNPAQGQWFRTLSLATTGGTPDEVADGADAAAGRPEDEAAPVAGLTETAPRVREPLPPTQPAITIPPDGSEESRSLKFELSSAADRLVCDLQGTAVGTPRDWSEFGALLLRIWGPPDGADATLLLRSGGPTGFGEASFPFHMAPGWNLLTIDLDALSRDLERHDMRQVELSPVVGSKSATLYIDDLVLADRTRWYTGRDGAPGALYAYARGPRIFVGVHGGFQLAFAEGAIAAWYAAGSENLAGRGGLGPWPAFLANGWSGRAEDSAGGLIIAGPRDPGVRPVLGQEVLEATASRVVLAGSREMSPGGSATEKSGNAELRRCSTQYVIYADGRVLVNTLLDAGPSAWPLSRCATAMLLDSAASFTLADRLPATPEHNPATFALLTRTTAGGDLLWTPHVAGSMRWRRYLPETGDDPSLLITGELPVEQTLSMAQLLWFCPTSLDAVKAEEVASDYQEPLALRPDTGVLVTDVPGDLNNDGYNESEGCYELALQRGRLRFRFDPGALPRQTPLFRIHTDANTRCWAYANGQAFPADARDGSGRILFTLPGVIRTPRVIEIYGRTELP